MTKQELDRYIEVSKRAEELLKELRDRVDSFMTAATFYAPEIQNTCLFDCMVNMEEDMINAIFVAQKRVPLFYEDTDSVDAVYSPLTGEG